MPVSRDQVRQNLSKVIEYQRAKPHGYGELLLAVWYAIDEELQDVFLLEVFEKFVSLEGKPFEKVSFPGMGELWISGLYKISVFSRAEFEKAVEEGREPINEVREHLAAGRAEIIWPEGNLPASLAGLL